MLHLMFSGRVCMYSNYFHFNCGSDIIKIENFKWILPTLYNESKPLYCTVRLCKEAKHYEIYFFKSKFFPKSFQNYDTLHSECLSALRYRL